MTVVESDTTEAPKRPRAKGIEKYLLVLPAVILLLTVFAGSLAQLFGLSLRPYSGGTMGDGVTLDNYLRFASDPYSWRVLGTTVMLGAVCAAITVVLAYPMALALHRTESRLVKTVAIVMIFSPLLTSVIVRAYGWNVLLGDGGVLNRLLIDLGVIDAPLRIMYENAAVVVAMVHVLLPFAIFPILGVIGHVHRDVLEAAEDLGSTRTQTFVRVMLPLTARGILLTIQLCFALTISAFATPALLGGGRVQVLSGLVYTNVGAIDWPMAAVQSFVLLIVTLLIVLLSNVALALINRRRAL